MRWKKLSTSVIMVCLSALMLVCSAVLVFSAQQQSAGTSLTVNFNGQNVNYEVQGWYHVSGGNRTALVNASGGNVVSFSANEAPTEKTLKVSNTEANNKVTLTANNTYVLFTYKFVNTASSGAFGMEVSLSLTNVSGSNLKAVKYGTSTTLYIENDLSTFISSNVTSTTSFDDDFIIAGGTTLASSGTGVKYYYVLLEIDDVTLPVNFTPTFNWTVTCSEDVEQEVFYTLTLVSGGNTVLNDLGESNGFGSLISGAPKVDPEYPYDMLDVVTHYRLYARAEDHNDYIGVGLQLADCTAIPANHTIVVPHSTRFIVFYCNINHTTPFGISLKRTGIYTSFYSDSNGGGTAMGVTPVEVTSDLTLTVYANSFWG